MTNRAWRRATLAMLILVLSVQAQNSQSSSSPAATPSAEGSPTAVASPSAAAPKATPIPISDLIIEAESLNNALAETENGLVEDPEISVIENQLPILTQKIEAESARTQQLLSSSPSIDNLNLTTNRWNALALDLPGWQKTLSDRTSEQDAALSALDRLKDVWTQSLEAARQGDVPPEIISRVEGAITAIQTMRDRLETRRKQLLTVQERVASQASIVNNTLSSVKAQRAQALSRMLVRDSSPLWKLDAFGESSHQVVADLGLSYKTEWDALKKYAQEHIGNFVLQFILLLVLLWPLYAARRRIREWMDKEPILVKTAHTFRLPFFLGLAIVMLISGSFYPNAPRLLTTILGLIALISTVIILRPIINPSLLPILYALAPFSLLAALGNVTQGLSARLVQLTQALAAILFLLWFLRRNSRSTKDKAPAQGSKHFLKPLTLIALAAYIFSAVANVVGYVSLSKLSSRTILVSVYAAVLLYGAVIIAQALVVFALRVKPLALSRAVYMHRVFIRQRIMRWVRWLAMFLWFVVLLKQLAISDAAYNIASRILTYSIGVGTIGFTLGHIFSFCLTIWFAIVISRLISFLLEEEVFPRLKVARGIPYAVTRVMQYLILFVGFLLALGAMGIDLTHLTILTGAFGVGLGFGLQNVINNFVSGLILLFERPVNVDDAVQIGQNTGTLRQIGLRASVLRTWQGSEVIVPNGDLISKEVVNWTLSDQKRRMDIEVGVAYGTDPRLVIELLTKVAEGHPDVLEDPSPSTLFVGFGDNSLNFQLRAWTTNFEKWMQVKSDVAIGVHDTLAEANISIPFPQRDLHLRTIAPEAARAANGSAPVSAKKSSETGGAD